MCVMSQRALTLLSSEAATADAGYTALKENVAAKAKNTANLPAHRKLHLAQYESL